MRNLVPTMALALLSACAPPAPGPSRHDSAPQPAAAAASNAPPLDWLDRDLPSPSSTLEITRRAMATLRTHDGFLPAINQVTACYDGLSPASSLEGRVYCLQLDSVAYAIEEGAPADYQAADARFNDYFTTARFNARQTQFVPPLSPAANADQRKTAAIEALTSMRREVVAEEVVRLRALHAP